MCALPVSWIGGLLLERQQRVQFGVRSFETCVELVLVVRVQCVQIHGLDRGDRDVMRIDPPPLRTSDGNKHCSRQELLRQVFGIGPALGEIDAQRGAAELLDVDGVQQLHGDHDLVAWLGIVKQDSRLQVVAHGHAASIEVENLGHRPVGVGMELEPDARAGQVVAIQRVGNRKCLAKPHGIHRGVGAHGRPFASRCRRGSHLRRGPDRRHASSTCRRATARDFQAGQSRCATRRADWSPVAKPVSHAGPVRAERPVPFQDKKAKTQGWGSGASKKKS